MKSHVRSLLVAFSVALACAAPSLAADASRADLFAGYSYHDAEGGGLNGWQASLGWNLWGKLGLLADASGHFTPGQLAEDLSRAKVGYDVPIYIYHIKPVHKKKVIAELKAMGRKNVKILVDGKDLHPLGTAGRMSRPDPCRSQAPRPVDRNAVLGIWCL